MKVKETVERECCQLRDFRALAGTKVLEGKIAESVFCQYCGKRYYYKETANSEGDLVKEYASIEEIAAKLPETPSVRNINTGRKRK